MFHAKITNPHGGAAAQIDDIAREERDDWVNRMTESFLTSAGLESIKRFEVTITVWETES